MAVGESPPFDGTQPKISAITRFLSSYRDIAEQYVLPLLVGVTAVVWSVDISGEVGVGALTLSALFSAFLFQLTIQLLERAASWADMSPTPAPETTEYAKLLEELSANAGLRQTYASLVSAIAAASSLLALIAKSGWAERVGTGLTVGFLVHLSTAMLLVLRRVFLLTRSRLNAARTGKVSRRSA